jgi:ribosomal protein S18 acetylase RimI-like enzyme
MFRERPRSGIVQTGLARTRERRGTFVTPNAVVGIETRRKYMSRNTATVSDCTTPALLPSTIERKRSKPSVSAASATFVKGPKPTERKHTRLSRPETTFVVPQSESSPPIRIRKRKEEWKEAEDPEQDEDEKATFHVLRGNNLKREETSASYKQLFNSCFPGDVRLFMDDDYVVVYGLTPRVESWRAFCIVRPALMQKSRTYRWPVEKLRRRLPVSAVVRYDIMDLGVDPTFRGRGIGNRLLTYTLATVRAENARLFAEQVGIFVIDIQVYATNPIALAMYKNHGFRILRDTAAINDDTHLFDRYIELSMAV